MITVWWLKDGIVHYNFLEKGKTIITKCFSQYLLKRHKKLSIFYPALANRKTTILLHDDARPHIGKIELEELSELGYEVLLHLPYSPDIAPTDYHLFSHLEDFLDNKIFNDEEEVKNAVNEFFNSKQPRFFCDDIDDQPQRQRKCVESDENYFD